MKTLKENPLAPPVLQGFAVALEPVLTAAKGVIAVK